MACDSDKGLSKSKDISCNSLVKPKRIRRIRPWLSSWSNELSDNGEPVKIWCQRLKEPGMARCKYCKIKINYSNKGLSALRCHSNTRKHLDNGRHYHLKVSGNSSSEGPVVISHSKSKKKPSFPSQKTLSNIKSLSSSTSIGGGGGQSLVQFKGKLLKSDLIKAQLSYQHHLKHTIIPSASSKPPSSALSSKFTIPVLSKKFLQFKTKPSKTPLPSNFKLSTLKLPSLTLPKVQTFKNILPHSKRPAKKRLAPAVSSQINRNPVLPKYQSRPLKDSQSKSFSLFQSTSASPIPAKSLFVVGNQDKFNSELNQVYDVGHIRATGSPRLGQTVVPVTKLIPVFVCYFCHEDFPSKSCLYDHQEQCKQKLDFETSGNSSSSNKDIIADNSSTSSTASAATMNGSTITTNTTNAVKIKLVDKDAGEIILPTTPNNPKQIPNAFFPSECTPQKQLSSLSSSLHPNNSVSKASFLNNFNLLPIKTALQEQKRISRKRRNTECESLDWVEGDIPITPKTPCTPPTPKLLISHLSREEYRRELHPHRLFRLSSSTSSSASDPSRKNENDAMESDKDLMDFKSDGMKSHPSNATDGENKEKDERQDGKISVVRSLYNVDVTSPLGQFVIRHYKGDPSLHILSDIESHCLTSPTTSTKTTNFSLRARNVVYPIMFGGAGRRLLYHDYYHSYKFNKVQVREFMKTANTGLNKDSRRLLRQMKKCQIVLRRISKSDLRYWISSQNNITVDLKLLSLAEISQWTSPKPISPSSTSSSPTLSDDSDRESVFPDGFKPSTPTVKNALGLKTKQEVSIKIVDMFTPSILSIANYISEETCADLLSNRKTIYRSLLSDWSKNDSENVDVSSNNVCFNTPQEQKHHHQQKGSNNAILRHMLSSRPVLGSCLVGKTLPDITNLTAGRATADLEHIKPKFSPVDSIAKPKTTPEIDAKLKSGTMKARDGGNKDKLTPMEGITSSKSKNSIRSRNKFMSQPAPVIESKADKIDICGQDEVDSCSVFINLPNLPCDLLREKTPSQTSNKSRQSSPDEPPSTSTTSTSTSISTNIKRRQSNRLRQGPKILGPHVIECKPPTIDTQEILSIENNSDLLKSFLEHFKCLREEEKQITNVKDSGDKSIIGNDFDSISSPQKSHMSSEGSTAKRRRCVVGDKSDDGDNKGRLDWLKSFLEGRTTDKGIDDITANGKDVNVVNINECKKEDVKKGISGGDKKPIHRLSRAAKRSSGNLANSSPNLQSQHSTSNRRRKSSPRVTARVKKVGLNRRLSAAGLVKREESLGSPRSPVVCLSRSPISALATSSTIATPLPSSIDGNTWQTEIADNSKSLGDGANSKLNRDNFSSIRVVIKREKIQDQRNSGKFQHLSRNRNSGRESPIPKLRFRNCSKLSEKSECSQVSEIGCDGEDHNTKVTQDTPSSRSSMTSHTRNGGLSRRKRTVLPSSSSSSSLVTQKYSRDGDGISSATATPKSTSMWNGVSSRRSVPSVVTGNSDVTPTASAGAHENNETSSTRLPQSHQPYLSKGGILQFVSSFKLI